MQIGDIIIEQTTDLGQDALDNPQKYSAFLGVSIRNFFFSKKTMRAYFIWASKQFKELVVLLMDDPDKYNLIALKGMDEMSALKTARNMSDDTKSAYTKIIRDLRVENIRIVQFRDFINDPKYMAFAKKVKDFYTADKKFQKAIYEEMCANVEKKIKHLTEEERQVAEQILVKYMYEETVPMLYFTNFGYPIEIDPHREFIVKKTLYEGQFKGLHKALSLDKRGHFFARPEFNQYEKVRP